VATGFVSHRTNTKEQGDQLLRGSLNSLINRVEQSLHRDLSPVERDCLEAARENLVLAGEALEDGHFSEANLLIRMAEQELWATL